MEAKLVATLVALMLFCVSSRGDAECGLSDLVVTQTAVPGRRGGQPSYLVTVQNRCICTQTDVKLACAGFGSSVPVDPAGAVTPDGDNALCTLNGGGPVTNDEAVKFHYASSTKFSFAPVSSSVSCSVA